MNTSTLQSRRYDLDWLRIIAFGLLIFYHIGMFYVTWDWHVKSTHASPASEWLMRLSNPWRLPLLFFISGVAIRFAADKTPGLSFARSRMKRLGLPILFGITVICMPQAYLQLVESGEFTGSMLAFYPQYLDIESDFSITTPTWNHLWYVVYLLPYTLILIAITRPVSRFMTGPGARLMRAIFDSKFGPLAALLLPALPHLAIRATLGQHFPTTHDLTNDWANHAHSFTYVLTGFLLAKDDTFWRAIRRALPIALPVTLTLGVGLSLLWANWESLSAATNAYNWVIWPARLARVLFAWCVIASLLGLAQRWLNRPSRALTYMTEAIFPWYILHQTLIIMAGFWLTRQGLSAGLEFALVTLATIAGCFLLHELVIRRIDLLRPLFGLKPKTKAPPPVVLAA